MTKCTRDIVFIDTYIPEERIFLLKSKAALDELPAESTDVESENVIQRYSKRPRQLGKFYLADYISKIDIIYPKGNTLPEKVDDTNVDDSFVSSSGDEGDDCLNDSNSQNQICCSKQKMDQNTKQEKYQE